MIAAVVGALTCAAVLLAWPTRRAGRAGVTSGPDAVPGGAAWHGPAPRGSGVGPGVLGRWRARLGASAREEAETDALIEVVEALDAALAAGATPLEALVSVDRVRRAVRGLDVPAGEGAATAASDASDGPEGFGGPDVPHVGVVASPHDGRAGPATPVDPAGPAGGGRGAGEGRRFGALAGIVGRGGRRVPASSVDAALPILIARARAGDGLAAGWADVAARLHSPQLDLLSRAWTLSEASGASLAAAARTAVRLLRSSRDERRRTEAAVAGARATMAVLTMLPLGGPFLAVVVGLDPGRVYLGSPATALMLGGGVVLVLVGRWWVGRLVASALRGPGLS